MALAVSLRTSPDVVPPILGVLGMLVSVSVGALAVLDGSDALLGEASIPKPSRVPNPPVPPWPQTCGCRDVPLNKMVSASSAFPYDSRLLGRS
eukprot:CAMPEP_0172719054 /NCGR_PEP_ID=MMETSP1074-20121228/75283_1 /TAXON_ID=2916 /ORGANISM="Ceratium fusus, Strain PA161109" /LENGTH=92 /DNA_ID=CAMNT_0013544365 /DNA_START=984 /DNA_END=1262 /DNA_ORIENTATION=+